MIMTTRRNFLKKACMSGICICGFSSIAQSMGIKVLDSIPDDSTNKNEMMFLKWITELLNNLDNNLTESQLRQIVKSASIAHHQNLDMDTMLTPFKGKLDDFIKFIEEKWGWKVSYEDNKQVLIVDEAPRDAFRSKSRITMDMLLDVISKTRPSVAFQELQKYEAIRSRMEGSQSGPPPDRPRIGFK